jgi:hypothetical protein
VAGCARLPLALSLVAAYASARPELPLSDTAAALTRGELDGPGLADTFEWSYARLSPDAAGTFRAVGAAPLPEIAADAVASLDGVPAEQARTRLGELARASLVTEVAGGRFTMHDLLRADARPGPVPGVRRTHRGGDRPVHRSAAPVHRERRRERHRGGPRHARPAARRRR